MLHQDNLLKCNFNVNKKGVPNLSQVLFYTLSHLDVTEIAPESLQRHDGKITGLKLHKIIWYNRKLKGKISWDRLRNTDRQQR